MNDPENGNKSYKRRLSINYIKSDQKSNVYSPPAVGILEQIEDYNRRVSRNLITCMLSPCPRCHVCADQFKRHEIRQRQFNVIVDQVIHTVSGLLIRWVCPGCGKTFSQYPAFALPYKRYVLPDMIEYAQRYLETEDMTYAQLVRKWAAGYQRTCEDESQLMFLGFEDVSTMSFDSVIAHVHWVYCAYILLNWQPPGIPAEMKSLAEKQKRVGQIIQSREKSRIMNLLTQFKGVERYKNEIR